MTDAAPGIRGSFFEWVAAALLLCAGLPASGSAQTVQGHLTDARTRFAMSSANVALRDSTGTVMARTEANYLGAFQVIAPAPGLYSLLVEAMGYRSTESEPFRVREGEVSTIDLAVPPEPVELDSLAVEAKRQRIVPNLERQGFYQRMEEGFGHFITPEEIEKKHPRYFSDLFQSIPWAKTDRVGNLDLGPRCRNASWRTWIDGVIVADGGSVNLGEHVSIDEIAAVEVYFGPASVPLQYGGTEGQCVVLIWTVGGGRELP